MKIMIALILCAGVAIGALAYYLVNRDEQLRFQPLQLAADWQEQLRSNEARFTDMRPTLEKTVRWQQPQQRSELVLVYLHGFFASKGESSPVIEQLADSLAANVFFTRLRGHGRSDAALAEASVSAWYRDSMEAWEIGKQLGDKVVLVGASTGASLAILLAQHVHDDPALAGLVLLSPNFHPRPLLSTKLILLPGGLSLARLLLGANPELPRANDLQRLYWNSSYPVTALLPMMRTVRALQHADLSRIKAPLIMLYSPQDRVVDSSLALQRWQQFGSEYKDKIALSTNYPGNHILIGDAYSPENNQAVLEALTAFIKQNISR